MVILTALRVDHRISCYGIGKRSAASDETKLFEVDNLDWHTLTGVQ